MQSATDLDMATHLSVFKLMPPSSSSILPESWTLLFTLSAEINVFILCFCKVIILDSPKLTRSKTVTTN